MKRPLGTVARDAEATRWAHEIARQGSQEEAEGQARPAEPAAALGAAAERRAHPQAAQGKAASSRTTRTRPDRPSDATGKRVRSTDRQPIDEERDERMAMTATSATAERALAERGKAVDAAILGDREAVRPRLDHEARLGRAAGRSTRSRRGRSRSTSRSASAASRAAGSRRSSARSRRARPRSASTSSPRPSGVAASSRSSTSSTRSIPGYARACGVNVDELLVSASRTPASRRSRSPRR